MDSLSLALSKNENAAPTKLGKLLVLKSGKVVLRMASKEGQHVDFEVIKGIETNFY